MHIKSGVGAIILRWIVKFHENVEAHNYIKKKFRKNNFNVMNIQGKQTNLLLKDVRFKSLLSAEEKSLWEAFHDVVFNFLGKNRSRNYRRVVSGFVSKCGRAKPPIKMTYKLHILDRHLDEFSTSNSDFSDENSERFHQLMNPCAQRNKAHPAANVLADFCWRLVLDAE